VRNLVAILMLVAVTSLGTVALWKFLAHDDASSDGLGQLAAFTMHGRPQSDRHLFDYASAVVHYQEGIHRYLKRIASRFHVEALIVSVPALPDGHDIDTLAVDLVNNWRIGAEHDGRALLLLLVDDIKQVKLEVGYALEDVFTDSFSGYVEDLQLGPNYRAGDLGIGLIAVMEEIERRAQIKAQGEYTPRSIARADAQLLAGGAGAKRRLNHDGTAQQVQSSSAARPGKAARSPEEAWETMLAKWGGEGAHMAVEVYTEMTRLAMGDADRPDPRALKWLDHWRSADYQVLREEGHAVIWFGAMEGWENAPFLFCDTGAGWRFDIVHQRRLVVMAEHPKWQVAQGPYPYVELLRRARQSTAKDLPLSGEDLYRCADDAAIAVRMRELQVAVEKDPDDLEAIIALIRLNVITGQRPHLVHPLIDRAKQLAPQRPEPYRYSAIFNVNSFFQYQSALTEIERYIELRPNDAFGNNLKGFVQYRLGRYAHSIASLERALELAPDNGYAYALMSRDYALLARKASAPRKAHYRKLALRMRERAASVPAPDAQRLARLDRWLARRL
jgi:hypothetical protein